MLSGRTIGSRTGYDETTNTFPVWVDPLMYDGVLAVAGFCLIPSLSYNEQSYIAASYPPERRYQCLTT